MASLSPLRTISFVHWARREFAAFGKQNFGALRHQVRAVAATKSTTACRRSQRALMKSISLQARPALSAPRPRSKLLERGDTVVGLDNFNDYYDVSLKEARAAHSRQVRQFFDAAHRPRRSRRHGSAVHERRNSTRSCTWRRRRACATRSRIRMPISTAISSARCTFSKGCRHNDVEHLVYASSSSVYGANTTMPFSIHQNVDHPLALYGATKKANELMAHTYSNLYELPTTGLRFFTVYGPWGRPDMALFLFTKNIIEGKPIDVFNYGKHRRDFTYIDDIVEGVVRTMDNTATPNRGLGSGKAGSGHEPGAVSDLQHRQSAAGRADGLHRRDRGMPRQESGEEPAAAAARRRAGYLGRYRAISPRTSATSRARRSKSV